MKDCVSLEVAQKLQKAGYKSECEHYWHETEDPQTGYKDRYLRKRIGLKNDPLSDYDTDGAFESIYAAPTATQLAEELPAKYFNSIYKEGNGYGIKAYIDCGHTLPDALGLMMCYLLENKLI
jgi:hypothetical protein